MNLVFNPKDMIAFASSCLDRTVKMWSLGSSTPYFTLEAHEKGGVNYVDFYPGAESRQAIPCHERRRRPNNQNNVSFAVFHPIRLENNLSYALERAWCIAIRPQGNKVAVGYDDGVVVVKLGRDETSFTFSTDPDPSTFHPFSLPLTDIPCKNWI